VKPDMPSQELTENDLKIIENLRYTKDEYKKAKPIAQKASVDRAEVLDMSIQIGLIYYQKFGYN
jgi:hypothetical protein